MQMKDLLRSKLVLGGATVLLIASLAISFMMVSATAYAAPVTPHFAAVGGLDCNGFSATGQKPLLPPNACTDIQGPNGERGEDNGHYVGHDEPAVQFYSQAPGSGNNVQ